MEASILNSTKKILGLGSDYTAFDLDVLTYINSAFSTLHQLGVGPITGFSIQDAETTWDEYISDETSLQEAVKTYVYLRVRLLFDPPTTSFAIGALKEQLQEIEWRISVLREATGWVDPNTVEEEVA